MNRSLAQNRALHLYCKHLADELNDSGQYQKAIITQFKEGFEIPWTMEAVKHLFQCVAYAMYEKEHTSDLTTTEIQDVYRIVDQRISEISGCRADWPSIESLEAESIQQLYGK